MTKNDTSLPGDSVKFWKTSIMKTILIPHTNPMKFTRGKKCLKYDVQNRWQDWKSVIILHQCKVITDNSCTNNCVRNSQAKQMKRFENSDHFTLM